MSRRQKKRISIFKSIIGRGNERILEIGCGFGYLTHALVDHANKIVGIDISAKALEVAKNQKNLLQIHEDRAKKIEFLQMSAVRLDFPKEFFDWVISTSMIEHLHPDDIEVHLSEIWRVLKPKGQYLVWCPNKLGHHKNREGHLSMFSYSELMERMKKVGFCKFKSSLFCRSILVDACYKAFLERILSGFRVKILWSHLGVRNILLVALK